MPAVYVDPHTHLHLRPDEDLQRLAEAGIRTTVVCAYLPVTPSAGATLEDLYAWLVHVEVARQRAFGIRALPAVGIHPRCIPGRGLDEALTALERCLAGGGGAALGEVGLESRSEREVDVFSQQLRIAARLEVPVVVHTPREGKAETLPHTLALLEASGLRPGRVLVDHLTPELVSAVRARGYWAGLTVQPGKLGVDGVLAVIRAVGAEGLMVDSDVAQAAADPLAVAHTAGYLLGQGVPTAEVDLLTRANALAWLA